MNTDSGRIVLQKAGYRRERLPGGILILRLTDGRAETVDAWFEDCNRVMAGWRPGRRLRYLHDIRAAERVTPRATDQVVRVLRRMRSLPVTDGRGAILLRNPALTGLLSSFLRRQAFANWRIRFFTEESEALSWLNS